MSQPAQSNLRRLGAFVGSLGLAGALFLPAAAVADPIEGREQRMDRRDGRDNQMELRDDYDDAARLSQLVDSWHDAWARSDVSAERKADDGLKRWLNQEIHESKHESKEAKQESARSNRERRRSRHEAQVSTASGKRVGAVDDRHDLRDDRRDQRDDKQDAQQERDQLERKRQIRDELKAMQPSFDRGVASAELYQNKSALLRELQRLASAEITEDYEEKHEDKVERREDRRERIEP